MTDTEKKPTALIQNRPVAENTDELFAIARGLADSALCPDAYKKKPKDAFAAIVAGAEVGFQSMQSLKTIAVINGRPSIFADGLPAIALASGQLERLDEGFLGDPFEDDFRHWIEIERKGIKGVRRFEFSVADAKLANLWILGTNSQKPWAKYPKRMLQMRNRAYAFRDCFADYLAGLHVAEEQQDIPQHAARIEPEDDMPTFAELAQEETEPSDNVPYPEPDVIDVEPEPVGNSLDTWVSLISDCKSDDELTQLVGAEISRDCSEDEIESLKPIIEKKRQQFAAAEKGELF